MSRTAVDILLLWLVVAFVAVALASCAPQTIKVPERVSVRVPVACIPPEGVPQNPAVRSEADLMAMDTYRRTLAAWSDLRAYEAYTAELEALVSGCSRIPP